ncbi:MAG: phage portal protein [Actinomycetota bacterium]
MLALAEAVHRAFAPVVRSLENPSVPLSAIDADSDVWNALTGGAESLSGVKVTRRTALGYAPFWRGVNLLARDVGKLPLFVHRRVEEANSSGKRRATGHPAFRLLRRKPNPWTNAFHFKQTLTGHAVATGNGYAFIDRDDASVPRDLLQLLPDRCTPVKANGQLWYVVSVGGTLDDDDAELRRVPAENVLHVKGLGFDGLIGYDPIAVHRDTLGKGIGTRRFGAVYFKNAAAPHIVLEHPGTLSDTAFGRLQGGWQTMRSGLDRAHKTAILEDGLKANVLSANADDAQLTEAQQFDLVETANVLGLPPHKLGGEGRTSYNSLEMEQLAYLNESLDPWLIAWEEECWDKLLSERQKERDTHFVEFERKALVRADLRTRAMFYRLALGGQPFMSVNDVRGLENMNPVEGGDEISKPLNMSSGFGPAAPQGGGEGQGDDEEPEAEKEPVESEEEGGSRLDAEPFRQLLAEALGRVAKRLSVRVRKAAGKPSFDAFLDGLAEAERSGCVAILAAPADVCRAAGFEVDAESLHRALAGLIREQLQETSTRHEHDLPAHVAAYADALERDAATYVLHTLDPFAEPTP